MLSLIDYILIAGTFLLLGGAVLSFVAVCVIRVYLAFRFSILEHDRYVTYARHEAPHAFHVARLWLYRLAVVGFALTFAYLLFMGFMFKFFKEP